jgi:hypothetical protein
LLKKGFDLLLGIFPRQPLLITALQVLQGSLAVQLRNRKRRLLIHKALSNQILTRHWVPRRSMLPLKPAPALLQARSEIPDVIDAEETPCDMGMVKMLCLSSFRTTKR